MADMDVRELRYFRPEQTKGRHLAEFVRAATDYAASRQAGQKSG